MTRTSRAAALFASRLQPSECPGTVEVAAAIRGSLLANGGVDGCAAAVALEYGDHPETAAARMRWALSLTANGRARTAA